MVVGVHGELSRLAVRPVEVERKHDVGCVTILHLLMEELTALDRTQILFLVIRNIVQVRLKSSLAYMPLVF